MNTKKRIKGTTGDYIFEIINTLIMLFLVIITVYPFYYVVIASVSDNVLMQAYKGIMLTPQGFNLGAFKLTFQHPLLLSGYRNIFIVLLFALPLNLLMTVICAYFMASRNMMFKRPIVIFMLFTMYFSGGLIPTYLNQKGLGFYNNYAALVVPGCLSLYNAIIMRTAMEAIPESLSESAYIDGAGELTVLFRIFVPLLKPTMAVILLYYGVGHWNSWFNASIYIEDNDLLPLQNILRALLIENSDIFNAREYGDTQVNSYTETIKYAAIVVSTVPILCVYPYLQKYFAKGVMIGAVKG